MTRVLVNMRHYRFFTDFQLNSLYLGNYDGFYGTYRVTSTQDDSRLLPILYLPLQPTSSKKSKRFFVNFSWEDGASTLSTQILHKRHPVYVYQSYHPTIKLVSLALYYRFASPRVVAVPQIDISTRVGCVPSHRWWQAGPDQYLHLVCRPWGQVLRRIMCLLPVRHVGRVLLALHRSA